MISFIYQIQQKNMCTTRKFAKIFICYYSIIVTFWETVACQNSKCLSECVQLLLLILVTMGQVFMKLGENVGTYVRLIVLKFHYKLHCWYYFIWFYFFLFFALLQRDRILCQWEIMIMLCPDCDTTDSNIVMQALLGGLVSSVGRASDFGSEGQGFDSWRLCCELYPWER